VIEGISQRQVKLGGHTGCEGELKIEKRT